jgi:nucleoside-diphosphate-sugar epimerase
MRRSSPISPGTRDDPVCGLPARTTGRRVIAVFGVGLVGTSIVSALRRSEEEQPARLPLSWTSAAERMQDLDRIATAIRDPGLARVGQLDIIWAAGRAGFGAGRSELEAETVALKDILHWSAELAGTLPQASATFHLFSSAGGLFEGQRFVDAAAEPRPIRPYGEAKLAQEALLATFGAHFMTHVYRPSSVYGYGAVGGRAGLLSTLIENSWTGRATRIFGDMDTVRDYVLSSDIGTFVARKIAAPDKMPHTYLLANGKPASIGEMLQLVRKVVGRPINLKLDILPSNANHITFRPAALPRNWWPTDLETGIRLVARGLSRRFATGLS